MKGDRSSPIGQEVEEEDDSSSSSDEEEREDEKRRQQDDNKATKPKFGPKFTFKPQEITEALKVTRETSPLSPTFKAPDGLGKKERREKSGEIVDTPRRRKAKLQGREAATVDVSDLGVEVLDDEEDFFPSESSSGEGEHEEDELEDWLEELDEMPVSSGRKQGDR